MSHAKSIQKYPEETFARLLTDPANVFVVIFACREIEFHQDKTLRTATLCDYKYLTGRLNFTVVPLNLAVVMKPSFSDRTRIFQLLGKQL